MGQPRCRLTLGIPEKEVSLLYNHNFSWYSISRDGNGVQNPQLENDMSTAVSAKIEGNELVIRLPLNSPPQRSATGKTMVVASSHGNQPTEATVDGQTVIVGVNAYFKPAK